MKLSYIEECGRGYNTDTYKVITRTGIVNNHYLAFSGGTPQSNYRASFGVMDHNTIIKNMDYGVFVAKVDVTQKAFDDRLTGDFGVFGSSFKNHDILTRRCCSIPQPAKTQHSRQKRTRTATG